MKPRIAGYYCILFTPLVLIGSACDADDDCSSSLTWLEANALLDGEYWDARALIGTDTHCTSNILRVEHLNNVGELRHVISLTVNELDIGRNQVAPAKVFFEPDHVKNRCEYEGDTVAASLTTLTADGDAVTADYFPIRGSGVDSNYLEITSVSNDGTRVEGEFRLRFKVDDDRVGHQRQNGLPDTVQFTNGRFEALLHNE